MLQINVLIYEPNYLIKRAIMSIVAEINNNLIIEEVTNINSLKNTIADKYPDYLIINSLHLNIEIYNVKIILLEQDILLQNAVPQNVLICDRINISDTKDVIYNKLTNIFEKHDLKINSSKSDYLSAREVEIVALVAQGKTNQEIADLLFLSPHTIITHRKNITRKLGIKTVSGLTVYAILNNIISINN